MDPLMKCLLIFILATTISLKAHALRIQILHTNDLHSFFEGSRAGKGGYARLKTIVDELKREALSQDVPTLFLDGGDFGEGTSFYMADEGADSLRMLDQLGIDAAVLGNHDYMQGGKGLAKQIEKAKLKAKILSANLSGEWAMGLRGKIPSMVFYQKAGIKIGVFGLSTAEPHFQYPILNPGVIFAPYLAVPPMELYARAKKADFLIALTHIGFPMDKFIVKNSKEIDLVVGGHTHIRLAKPFMQKNLNGKEIPILQAGSNAMGVGQLIIEFDPKTKKHQFISYKIHNAGIEVPFDPETVEKIEEAKVHRAQYFKRDMEEVIGESHFPLNGGSGHTRITCWGTHLANMTREITKANIGLHIANFEGELIPAGPIRYLDMVDNFPHFRNFGDGGWDIVVVKLNGFLLYSMFEALGRIDGHLGMHFAGVNMPAKLSKKGHIYRIGGNKVNLLKSYSIAFPSEVIFAIEKVLPWLKGVLYHGRVYTGLRYWTELEKYIKTHSPMKCIDGELKEIEVSESEN
jgi:2',3'-cyclic-nucleotide 2'-phosphodiesterase (5'-nucleotidase family)